MSNIYNTQPPTKGKVVLVTSHGDVDVELDVLVDSAQVEVDLFIQCDPEDTTCAPERPAGLEGERPLQ